jgi:uncharacterized protein YegL
MISIQQIPFGPESFAENPEDRCPCVLVLDVSSSMAGQAINELQQGLIQYRDELLDDSLASKRVEIAVITFGNTIRVEHDFATARSFVVPLLTANGMTPMAGALLEAVRLVESRKQVYRQNGINYYRPWIFLITDGGPNDGAELWEQAKNALTGGVERKAFSFFAVGVQGAHMATLAELPAQNGPLPLDALRFRDLFVWLSRSQQAIARSQAGSAAAIPMPTWILET